MEKMNTSEKNKNANKNKNRNYQPLKPDPTSEPDNNVVSTPPSEIEIGSSIVRRNEADDED